MARLDIKAASGGCSCDAAQQPVAQPIARAKGAQRAEGNYPDHT
jgi:hypothetical protein